MKTLKESNTGVMKEEVRRKSFVFSDSVVLPVIRRRKKVKE